MDSRLRELERAVASGDSRAKRFFARELVRVGRQSDARPLYGDLLAENPADEVLRQEYLDSGGFWAELYDDKGGLGDSIAYRNLELDGKLVDVVVGNNFLGKGEHRTFDEWKAYVLRNKKGITIPTIRLEGVVARELFLRRDHPAFEDVVKQYVAVFREKEKSWLLHGKLTYGEGTQAILEEMSLDRKVVTKPVDVPFFDSPYCTLAEEKRESALGATSIPGEARSLLGELLGQRYEDVVKAFQFFTARRNNNLSEVCLWAPDADWRVRNPVRAVVLGRGVGNRFSIYCNVGIFNAWPARLVVAGAKIFHEK